MHTLYFIHRFGLLALLCQVRARITVHPEYDFELVPNISFIHEYLSIKLNDIVVLAIWFLVPSLCGKSILGQYRVQGVPSFPDIFFGNDVCLLRPMPILALLLTAASASYVPRLVYFIYREWTVGFNPLVQTLQVYPALMMLLQTVYQGTFLLRVYAKPSSLKTIAKHNMEECKTQLEANIMLNTTLLLHCMSMTVVMVNSDIVFQLIVGEILYRFWAVFAFVYLRHSLEKICMKTLTINHSKDGGVHSGEASCLTATPENSSTESTESEYKEELDTPPADIPSKTLSTEDPNNQGIDDTTASVNTDAAPPKSTVQPEAVEEEKHDPMCTEMVLRSTGKERQQSIRTESTDNQTLVSPHQCTDKPTYDSSKPVVPAHALTMLREISPY